MIDAVRVRTLLQRVQTEVDDLRRLAGFDAEVLLADRDKLKSIKYGFVVAVEACIDVGQHVIASQGYRAPANYGQVFTVLAEHGHVPAEDVPTLIAMAGFRNLLVHGYADIDDRRVIAALHERLDDFDRFCSALAGSVLRRE